MKCISLHAPWASLCVLASLADAGVPVKPYETRGFRCPPKIIGTRILIHAAKKWMRNQKQTCLRDEFQSHWARIMQLCGKQPLGCIVGAVDVVECYQVCESEFVDGDGGHCLFAYGKPVLPMPTGDTLAFGDFSIGRYAWALRNPVMFKTPIPYKGRQGFFNVPDDVVAGQMGKAINP